MFRLVTNSRFFTRFFSDESLTKKAYLNALAAALDYGAGLLTGFLVTPLVVSGLGDYFYGAWSTLQRMTDYITPATGRPTQVLKWMLAKRQHVAEAEEKRRYVGSAVLVTTLFIPILLVLGAVVVWFAPSWLHAPAGSVLTIRLTTACLILNLILVGFVEIPRSTLEGENLGYKRMGLTALLIMAGDGLTALALFLHKGIIGVAVAAVAFTVLTGVVFFYIVRICAPWFGMIRPAVAEVRRFFGLSWWFLAWNLVIKLMTASDVIVLGTLVSVEQVTVYSLTKYLPETVISIIGIMVFGVLPGLGGIIGTGDLKKAAQVRNEMMALTWLVVTATGAVILLWNRSFLGLWVGADHYAGAVPTLLCITVAAQFVLIRNDANIIDLTLDLRRKVIIGLLSGGLSVAIAGILVGYFKMGIAGLCCGFILGRLILSIGYPLMVGRFLKISPLSQVGGTVRPVAVTVLLFFLTLELNRSLAVTSWVSLVLGVGSTTAVILPLTFFAGLAEGQRRPLLARIRLMLAAEPQVGGRK